MAVGIMHPVHATCPPGKTTCPSRPAIFATLLQTGGFSTRELASIIRGLNGGLSVVGLEVVEVAPAYDHAEITALAAANLAYDVVALMAASQK